MVFSDPRLAAGKQHTPRVYVATSTKRLNGGLITAKKRGLAAPDPRSKLMFRENRVGAAAVPRTLVTTKLRAPRTRPNLVARPRLHEELDRGEERKLTLVSAPAGFGKTTLLVEWLMERSGNERSVVWVSLDESDNDPARFLSYLVGALQNVKGDIGEGVLASLRSPELPSIETVVGALINELV